jgi:hypothetical protein
MPKVKRTSARMKAQQAKGHRSSGMHCDNMTTAESSKTSNNTPSNNDSAVQIISARSRQLEFFYHPPTKKWQEQQLRILLPFSTISPSDIVLPDYGHILQPLPKLSKTKPSNFKRVLGDGNCFFRCISYLLTGTEQFHAVFRNLVCQHIQSTHTLTNQTPTEYLNNTKMFTLGTWATETEIFATASLLQTDIYVYTAVSPGVWKWLRHGPLQQLQSKHVPSLYLVNTASIHFDVVTAVDMFENCSNIVSSAERTEIHDFKQSSFAFSHVGHCAKTSHNIKTPSGTDKQKLNLNLSATVMSSDDTVTEDDLSNQKIESDSTEVSQTMQACRKSNRTMHGALHTRVPAKTKSFAVTTPQHDLHFMPPDYEWQSRGCQLTNLPLYGDVHYEGIGSTLSNSISVHNIDSEVCSFFKALSFCITGTGSHYEKLWKKIVQYEQKHSYKVMPYLQQNEKLQTHLHRINKHGVAQELDIIAAAGFLATDIYICEMLDSKKEDSWYYYPAKELLCTKTETATAIYLVQRGNQYEPIISVTKLSQTQYQVHRQTSSPTKNIRIDKENKRLKRTHSHERLPSTSPARPIKCTKPHLPEYPNMSFVQQQGKSDHCNNNNTCLPKCPSHNISMKHNPADKKHSRAKRSLPHHTKSTKSTNMTNASIKNIKKTVYEKTHNAYICISDLRYRTRSAVVQFKVNPQGTKSTIPDAQMKHVIINADSKTGLPVTQSFDGNYYICKSCQRTLKKGRIPSCNEVKYKFQVPHLPSELTTDNMVLNKCEAHLLKLIIPFIRVVHIPRSAEFKIHGPLICVESNIKQSLETVLPIDQELIPVALKRRPEYKGAYVEEVVSKKKIMAYFTYLKKVNPLFENIDIDEQGIDKHLKDSIESINAQDDWKNTQNHIDIPPQCSGSGTHNETQTVDSPDQDSRTVSDVDADEKYDLPEYLTEISDDTVIDDFIKVTNTRGKTNVSEIVASAIIEQEEATHKNTAKKHKNKGDDRMPKVQVAPGSEGKFMYWDTAQHLEEKAFPHLFPTGTGGYLSTYQKAGVGFANYVKQRILGIDTRFRLDTTYLFFLYLVKETLEINRSISTFFRKSKVKRDKYDVQFLKSAKKDDIERANVGYKVFKTIRGTSPYFQDAKNKVLGMIRQIGPPNLFLTLSAAELYWTDLIKMLLQKESGKTVVQSDIDSLCKSDTRKLLSRNMVDTVMHFNNRIRTIFTALNRPGLLNTFHVADYFFRIEFQQRGAPHVHSLLWIVDENDQKIPKYDKTPDTKQKCTEFIDSLISGQVPNEDDPLHSAVLFYQTHGHTFTCRKKCCKKIIIQPTEGHPCHSTQSSGPELTINSCRFKFPKFPMKKTTIIDAADACTPPEVLKIWRDNYCKIRKFILRQTYDADRNNMSDSFHKFTNYTFDEFLCAVGMTEDDYINALSTSVGSQGVGSEVFLKRDCKDVFTNNYNKQILDIHRANMDLSFILDEYACVAYILGYLTKGESGLSRLLKQIETETAKYGQNPNQQMKMFGRAIDNSREVSRPEAIYRMLGLVMCYSTRTHKFINVNKPSERDGLLRPNIEKLEAHDNPFFNSIIDYYTSRPDILQNICLAEFARDYDYLPSKEESGAEHLMTNNDDENETTSKTTPLLKLNNNMGHVRKRKKRAIVRYYLNKQNDEEIMRGLLLLFSPFRDENKEIHDNKTQTLTQLFQNKLETLENMRAQFEPNRDLLVNIMKAMEEYQTEDNDDPLLNDQMSDNESDTEPKETTSSKDLNHFLNLANAPKNQYKTKIPDRQAVCAKIRQLNVDQRCILDDVIQRLSSTTPENYPFYLYIAGRAGTGKTFLMNVLIEAAKYLLMKSGDDLDKNTVLTMSPTATAARLIGGVTIESALGIYHQDDTEQKDFFSKNSTLAFKYDQVRLLCIDEVSMLGARKLHKIHTRFEEILGKHVQPFAGLPVICTGDFLQLPPVRDCWIFNQFTRPNGITFTATNKWKTHFKAYHLQQKMRSLHDPNFSELCDRIGLGAQQLSKHDEQFLLDRIQPCPNEDNNDAYMAGKIAIIVLNNVKRQEINTLKLQMIDTPSTVFIAEDKVFNVDKYNKYYVLSLPYSKTGHLPSKLELKINCPVMLTVNINKDDGLTNGIRGYVVQIDESDKVIWVKFPNGIGIRTAHIAKKKFTPPTIHGCVPIQPTNTTFKLTDNPQNSIKIKRKQFPLILAYAITSHKAQGLTLDEVIIDFENDPPTSKKRAPAGSFYVAVYLKYFDKTQMVVADDKVKKELDNLDTIRKYTMSKYFLNDPVFTDHMSTNDQEVKLVYLNINGLLHGDHNIDLNSDLNLLNSHILCLSETKLSNTIQESAVTLNNFSPLIRLDFAENSLGMIIYKNNRCTIPTEVTFAKKFQNERCQIVHINIGNVPVIYVYIHPSHVTSGLQLVSKCLVPHAIIMGDINIDTTQKAGCAKLTAFTDKHAVTIALKGNTRGPKQLDHILIPSTFPYMQHTETYHNLYSDHAAISIRYVVPAPITS